MVFLFLKHFIRFYYISTLSFPLFLMKKNLTGERILAKGIRDHNWALKAVNKMKRKYKQEHAVPRANTYSALYFLHLPY